MHQVGCGRLSSVAGKAFCLAEKALQGILVRPDSGWAYKKLRADLTLRVVPVRLADPDQSTAVLFHRFTDIGTTLWRKSWIGKVIIKR